jgi:hypothetical protein
MKRFITIAILLLLSIGGVANAAKDPACANPVFYIADDCMTNNVYAKAAKRYNHPFGCGAKCGARIPPKYIYVRPIIQYNILNIIQMNQLMQNNFAG